MTIVFSGSPVANVELADSFNTWRLTTNKIMADAASLTSNNSFAGSAVFDGPVTVNDQVIVTGDVSVSALTINTGTNQKVSVIGSVAANTDLDLNTANIFDITLGANNLVLTFTNPPVAGFAAGATIILRQDSAGTRLATFANSVYTDAIEPLLTTNANATDVLSFFTMDGGLSYFGSQTMAAVS